MLSHRHAACWRNMFGLEQEELKTMRSILVIVVLGLAQLTLLAQAETSGSLIPTATWEQYRDEYTQSALCSSEEVTL
jgi:hypothetical protein